MINFETIIAWVNPLQQSFPTLVVGSVIAFAVLLMAADWVSDAATTLCLGLKAEPLFVGMVIVGLFSALPEIAFIFLLNKYIGAPAALGGVMGGIWFGLLLPLGLAAIKLPLAYRERWVAWDLPMLVIYAIIFTFLCLDGGLNLTKGLILIGLGFIYLILRYHFGKESRYGLGAFGHSFTFGASMWGTLWRGSIGLMLLSGSALYLALVVATVGQRLQLPVMATSFTLMLPFAFPEVAFAFSAIKKGHGELVLGQGLTLATVLLLFGAGILGVMGLPIDPNAINFVHLCYIFLLVVVWAFLKFSERMWRWQGAVLVLLTLLALGVIWAQGYGKLEFIGLPRVVQF